MYAAIVGGSFPTVFNASATCMCELLTGSPRSATVWSMVIAVRTRSSSDAGPVSWEGGIAGAGKAGGMGEWCDAGGEMSILTGGSAAATFWSTKPSICAMRRDVCSMACPCEAKTCR